MDLSPLGQRLDLDYIMELVSEAFAMFLVFISLEIFHSTQ